MIITQKKLNTWIPEFKKNWIPEFWILLKEEFNWIPQGKNKQQNTKCPDG